VNLIVIDKQPQLQWLPIDQAIEHCARGASVWSWAGNDDGSREPDIVLACAGDVVTMETVAAAQILQKHLPQLRMRVVNVVDLMALIRPTDHPHGMSEVMFSELFTDSVNVVFGFHGFPGAVHQLIHGRPDTDRFHVRGFIEQGTTTTPFDMTVKNRASRFHLVMDAIHNSTRTPPGSADLLAWCARRLHEHEEYVIAHLEDLPDIKNWTLSRQPPTH
jgi:xylulose-5-phosphate/fructose-6-phosphate phosphoketolase